jgi:sugar/nucleoside kinase (ribokinase family)
VSKQTIDAIPGVISKLNLISTSDKSAFLGFDACIDYIIRIVREKKDNKITGYFTDSSQFGEFLINLDNKSCGVELQTKLSKIGGNMVITGNALGNLGISADCVGTFGYPEILPVFRTMSPNCSLRTIGETISATALEFSNSKVIMFDPGPYNNLTWEGIKNILGIEMIKELISGRQLISFLNWSEIENSSQIWEGILSDILPTIKQTGKKPFFFSDFSDCSRKSKKELQFALDLLGRFKKYFKVILSLNQNEADLIAKAMGQEKLDSDEKFIKELFGAINTDILIIHRTKDAIGYDGVRYEKCDTFFCKEPKILTGGGDNFNAGFCYAVLDEFNLFQSLLVANAVAGSYVKTGISPDINSLIDFLKQNSKSINRKGR